MIVNTGDIDPVLKPLLLGIIQPPPKDMKRFDKMTREDYLKRKRMKLGNEFNSEYDDEDWSGPDGEDDSDGDTTRGLTEIMTIRNRIAPVVLKP